MRYLSNMNHLKESGLTYWQHFRLAWYYIFKVTKVLVKLVIHSFFPSLFTDTGYFSLGKEK